MEAVVVGVLAAATAAMGAVVWLLLVRPRTLLSIPVDEIDPGEVHPRALYALRLAAAGMLMALGFLTGMALTFLTSTP